MSTYVLENKSEFERLEKQSQLEAYDYIKELAAFQPKKNGTLLDAGCGSGIVSRYLAEIYPEAKVTGCDFSALRVSQATEKAQSVKNLSFQTENLTHLSFEKNSFDGIVCRYVLEHLNERDRSNSLSELHRVLKPNGEICVVDVDGFIFNLFPQTKLVERVLSKLANERPIDLHVGRKIPHLLAQAGFSNIQWSVQTHVFQGEKLTVEIEQMRDRFQQVTPFFKKFLGSSAMAEDFTSDYFDCLYHPNAVLFYNMFSVIAKKNGLRKI